MDNQDITRLYFSNKQAKDSIITNAVRSLTWRATIAKALNTCGIEYGTITTARGFYRGGAEPSMQIFILGIDQNKGIELGQAVRKAFNQDSVMIEYNGAFDFIGS